MIFSNDIYQVSINSSDKIFTRWQNVTKSLLKDDIRQHINQDKLLDLDEDGKPDAITLKSTGSFQGMYDLPKLVFVDQDSVDTEGTANPSTHIGEIVADGKPDEISAIRWAYSYFREDKAKEEETLNLLETAIDKAKTSLQTQSTSKP